MGASGRGARADGESGRSPGSLELDPQTLRREGGRRHDRGDAGLAPGGRQGSLEILRLGAKVARSTDHEYWEFVGALAWDRQEWGESRAAYERLRKADALNLATTFRLLDLAREEGDTDAASDATVTDGGASDSQADAASEDAATESPHGG